MASGSNQDESRGAVLRNAPMGAPRPPVERDSDWFDVLAYFRTDTDLSTWLTNEELGHLVHQAAEVLAAWKEVTEYQGFNAKELLKIMRRSYDAYIADAQEESEIINYRYHDTDMTLTFSNKQPMMTDVGFLIHVFAVRGNVWDKIMRKSTGQLKTILGWMKEKYNIDTTTRDPNTALASNVVTVPRMAACFPIKICDFYSMGVGKLLCGHYDIGVDVNAQFDLSIFCSFFPAMVTVEVSKNNPGIHLLLGLIAIVNDNVLHKKDKKYTDLDQILSYYQASYNSPVMPQSSRDRFLRKKRLIEPGSSKLIETLNGALSGATARITNLRPSDPSLNKVLETWRDMSIV